MIQMKINRESLYKIYLLLCVLILTKAFTWLYTGQGAYILDESTSQGMRIHSAMTYVLLGSLLFYNWKALFLSSALRMIMITFIYFSLSAFWAYEPKESFRMSLSILFQFALAVAITRNAYLDLMLARLSFVAKGIILINCIFCILFYGLAVEPGYFGGSYSGALRGIFSSKNTFGAIIAFCYAAVLLEITFNSRVKKRMNVGWLLIAFGLLVLSMSMTSIATAVFTTFIAIAATSRWFSRSPQYHRVLILLSSLVLFCACIALVEPVLSMFGRDLTLTGRTTLWTFAFENYLDKPILGYGLNSFWREMLHNDLLIEHGLWNIGQAHNGFVDALLAGGLIGGGLVLLIYLKMLTGITSELVRTKVNTATPILMIFFWLALVQNLTETSFPYGIRIAGTLVALFYLTHDAIRKSRL